MLLLVLFAVGAFSSDAIDPLCSMEQDSNGEYINTLGSGNIATIVHNHHYENCQQVKNQFNCDMMNWINSRYGDDEPACRTCCEHRGMDKRQCIRVYGTENNCLNNIGGQAVVKLVEDTCQQLGLLHGNQMTNRMGCVLDPETDEPTCINCELEPDTDHNNDEEGSHTYCECYQKAPFWVKKHDCNSNDPAFGCEDKVPHCAFVRAMGGCSVNAIDTNLGAMGANACAATCGHCDGASPSFGEC